MYSFSNVAIHQEWFNISMKCLELSDMYNAEQIIKSKNPDCMELRTILVSALVKCGLSERRIAQLSGLSLQQIYRAKQRALEYGDSNHTYNRLYPLIAKAIEGVKEKQASIEHDISCLFNKD